MSAWRVGFWNGRGGHMQVFKYTDEHKNRMGCCDWLPKDGDLCLRVEDAGDCFHTYIALRQREDGKYERAGKFGAYIFGEAICKLNERTFYLACAGEPIDMPNPTENTRRPLPHIGTTRRVSWRRTRRRKDRD